MAPSPPPPPPLGYGVLRLLLTKLLSCFLPPVLATATHKVPPAASFLETPIKVAAIAGSLRKASTHKGLVRAGFDKTRKTAIEIAEENLPDVVIVDLDISPLPFLNTDLERNGKYPEVVEEFRARVLQADAILFASPEYNYSLTGPLKNAIDWASRAPNVWAHKPAAIVSAGVDLGGARSQYHLRQVGVYLDLHFVNKPEVFIRSFERPRKFDEDGNLVDPATKDQLKNLLIALHTWTLKLRGN